MKLFAFSGIDGAGKTSLINRVAGELRVDGYQVDIQKAYTDRHKEALGTLVEEADPIETLFLFQAMHRAQLRRTRQSLAAGRIVLADRWNEPYEVYHSRNGVLSRRPELRRELDEITFEGLTPSSTFYLKIDPMTAMRRTARRGADYFDAMGYDFHKMQADAYHELAAVRSGWHTLDANLPLDELTESSLVVIRHEIATASVAESDELKG